ncbi:MAG: alpha-amylase family glycosyl hydrolase [Siphonobacter sp.]
MSTTVFPQASTAPGMGAILSDHGVSFRVWAPNAEAVAIIGDFNDWDKEANPLAQEENGYWSIEIPEAKAGQNYKYHLITPFGEFDRNDPYARQVTNSVGNSIIVDPDFNWGSDEEQFRISDWNAMVIYELHVGTFNVKEQGKPSTFQDVIHRLDYLYQLGINAIEVMPVAEFPGDYSWGYNPAHPFAVETAYGGPNGFKELVREAHKRGIAVILDVVYNHFGPSDLDMWQFDGWQENGKGGIYFYNDWKASTPWGDTRPDYGRPEVRQYIHDNALMWLEEYHVDGLRMDMVPYIRHVNGDENPGDMLHDGYSLISWINKEIHEKYPYKFTVAEDLHGLDIITASVTEGGLGFSSQWDADFVHPIRNALIQGNDADRDLNTVAQALTNGYNGNFCQRVIYTESHDEVANGQARVVQEIASVDNVDDYFAKKRSTLGAALVLTAPGIPMLFQGQTILEDKWFDDGDPLDWKRLRKFKGISRLYQDLIHLRRNTEGTTKGLTGSHIDVYHNNNDAKLMVFHRWEERGRQDSTIVVANFSNQTFASYKIGMPASGLWKLRFNSDYMGYDKDFTDLSVYDTLALDEGQDHQPASATVSIAPYSVLIFSQNQNE